MIARLDHRPMLTAMLALSTSVLLVVVVTLLITLPPAASPPSLSGGGNPGAGPVHKVMDARSYGDVYGWDIQPKSAHHGDAGERHAKPVSDYAH